MREGAREGGSEGGMKGGRDREREREGIHLVRVRECVCVCVCVHLVLAPDLSRQAAQRHDPLHREPVVPRLLAACMCVTSLVCV